MEYLNRYIKNLLQMPLYIVILDNYTKNLNLSFFCIKSFYFFISTKLDLDILIFYKIGH